MASAVNSLGEGVKSDIPKESVAEISVEAVVPFAPASRSAGLGRHFIINSTSMVVGLIVSLVTVPIYVHQIGDARYGVLSIVWLLLGYLGFLDLGLSRAATNALAKLDSTADEERSRIVATSIVLNLAFGAIGGFILYGSGFLLLERIVSVPADLHSEIEGSLPWVAALLPLALVSGVAVGTLEARERFAAANVLQLVGSTTGQIVPVLCAVLIAPDLSVVIPAAVLSRAFGVLLIFGYVLFRNGPWMATNLDRETAGRLLGYGGWVTVSGIVSPILQSLDQIVIGSILGVASVTYYAVPMGLVIRSQLFAVALARSLFPRMSRLQAEEGRIISEQSLVVLAYGYAAICAPAILLVGPFLEFWIGPRFAELGAPVARILLIGGWMNGLAFIPFSLLQAQGRPDLPAKLHLLQIVPFVLVLWTLSSNLGIVGAALAWSLRVVADAGLLMNRSGMRASALRPLIPASGLMLACYATAEAIPLSIGPAFALGVIAGTVLVALAYLFSPVVASVVSRSIAFGIGRLRRML
ncbi:flippase [Methylobacterium sp. CM6247]